MNDTFHEGSTHLREISSEIRNNKDKLLGEFEAIHDVMQGELRYQYSVYMRYPEGGGDIYWTFKNSQERIYTEPTVGGTWDGYWYGRNDYIVDWYEKSTQQEVLDAESANEEARRRAADTGTATEEDIDAMSVIAARLASMLSYISETRTFFSDGSETIAVSRQRLSDDQYKGPAASSYQGTLEGQVREFDQSYADLEVLGDLCVSISEAITDVIVAMAAAYQARLEAILERTKLFLDIATNLNPTEWLGHVIAIGEKVAEAAIKQLEEYQEKIEELGGLVADSEIINRAQNLRRDSWPHPAPGALAGDW